MVVPGRLGARTFSRSAAVGRRRNRHRDELLDWWIDLSAALDARAHVSPIQLDAVGDGAMSIF
jgi:hypothetical protein